MVLIRLNFFITFIPHSNSAIISHIQLSVVISLNKTHDQITTYSICFLAYSNLSKTLLRKLLFLITYSNNYLEFLHWVFLLLFELLTFAHSPSDWFKFKLLLWLELAWKVHQDSLYTCARPLLVELFPSTFLSNERRGGRHGRWFQHFFPSLLQLFDACLPGVIILW